jgi:phosphate/phosphite/phosphonate ABC transporter binding protein
VVGIGVRQRLIVLIFSGLFVTMGLIGTYRYAMEERALLGAARSHGEQSARLIASLAAPYLVTSDSSGLQRLADTFLHSPDAREVTITDRDGRQLVHAVNPAPEENRIAIAPVSVMADSIRLGEVRLAVYPADLGLRLRSQAVHTLLEYLILSLVLAWILFSSVTKTITRPLRKLAGTLRDMIDRRDFTLRVPAERADELGGLASDVNYLIERLEQFVVEMGGISARINELSPNIAADTREFRKNTEVEAEAVQNVSSSVSQISSSIQSAAESAESLTVSAEETSSAILEMNASNQEVARHTAELTGSVEDVTASVTEMIASIREVAGHVESLSSAAEETSASAVEIEATVREVARAATESARLSLQVSAEAKESGVTSIHHTVQAINMIKEAVERYSGLISQLGKRSEEIGKILGVIVEVTERTNLLALNASILAAQAGENGRGFAVVAEEIKALAYRTAGSAQDIAKLVSAVQKETMEAVAAMSDGLAAVEEGVRRSHEADAALGKILDSSARSAQMATMIERAMSEQARGIRQVSESIANVKKMTVQIAAATQAQTKGTEMILRTAEDMRDISHQVKSAMTEQGHSGQQIAVAAENVTKRAGTIAAGTREQRQAIAQILKAIERIQDLPRENRKRMEGLAAALRALAEQGELLRQEFGAVTVKKGRRAAAGGTLLMGVIPLESPAEMYRRFSPLADYLGRAIGRRVELSTAVDFSRTVDDLAEGNTDLAFLTPTTYIEANRRCGAVVLVKALRRGVPVTHAAIVVRTGSAIARIEELRGKRIAFGDRMSTTSYLIPRSMLAEAGVGLNDLEGYAFLGHHDDVAKAVLAGEYDAGGLREAVARAFEGQGLSVLGTSSDIPEFNICVSKGLDPAVVNELKKALLALNVDDPDPASLLGLIDPDYTGFTGATDGDYDGIRAIVERMAGEES